MDADDNERATDSSVPTRIIKFGGTSVTGGNRIDTIAAVVRERLEGSRPVVVVSAFARVTTLLEHAAASARTGKHGSQFDRLSAIHEDAVRSMTASPSALVAEVDGLLTECRTRLDRIAERRSCPPEVVDEILSFGERLSCAIVSAGLVERGLSACAVDAASVIVTDANFGDARADLRATRLRIEAALPKAPVVPVVTGFLGATSSGVRTTLGREGSDYSAAVLAWGMDAPAVEIWTDVDGVMTADPRVVKSARAHRYLTYEELLELSTWGAKVVHPKTVEPLRDRGITLSIRNTLAPSDRGTRVGPVVAERAQRGPLGVTRIEADALLQSGLVGEAFRRDFNGGDHARLGDLLRSGEDYAVVTIVGDLGASAATRLIDADVLANEGLAVPAMFASKSGRSHSFIVRAEDGDAAVRTAHDVYLRAVAAHV